MKTCGDCLFMRAKIPVTPAGAIQYWLGKAVCVKGRIINQHKKPIRFAYWTKQYQGQNYTFEHLYKAWQAAENCDDYNQDDVDLI